MNKISLYSTEETAKKLGITRQALAYRVKKGKIKPADFVTSKYKFFSQDEVKKVLYDALLKMAKKK